MPSYYEKIAAMFSEDPMVAKKAQGYESTTEVYKAIAQYIQENPKKAARGTAKFFGDFIADLIPGPGDVKSAYEAYTGKSPFYPEREKFTSAERALAGIAAIPIVPGVIKRAKLAGPRIREVMAREFRSRGPKFEAGTGIPVQERMKIAGERIKQFEAGLLKESELHNFFGEGGIPEQNQVKALLDYVTRGPWFHGRRTYPKAGETFGRSRIGHTNLGEPTGVSLTGAESIAAKFSKEIPVRRRAAEKLQHKLRKLSDARLQRFLESKVGQRANKEYNQGMAAADRASTFAEKQRLDNITAEKYYLFQDRMFNTMPETKKITAMARSLDKIGLNEDIFARVVPRFGKAPADVILPAWKGPGTEYAQEILKDVYSDAARVVLRRSHGELGFQPSDPRAHKRGGIYALLERNNREMNEMIVEGLQKRGYKGLLYSPERFGEHELKMFNPQDVMMLDLRKAGADPGVSRLLREPYPHAWEGKTASMPGRQTKRLDAWNELTRNQPHSLRDIYEDIDLLKLHDEVMGDVKMPKAGYNPDITTKIKLDKAKKAELIKALPKGFADEVGVTLENLSNESLKALKKAADQGMTPFEAWIEASK